MEGGLPLPSFTNVTARVKEFRARVASVLRSDGMEYRKILEIFNRAGIGISENSLRSHIREVEASGSLSFSSSNSGRKMLLTERQKHICFGACLLEKKPAGLLFLRKFANTFFDTDVSPATWSTYVKDGKLSFQLTGKRPMPKNFSDDDYCLQYLEFLKYLRESNFWSHDPSKIICMDSCSNSGRTQRFRTLNVKNGKQRKMQRIGFKYTNNYVKAVAWKETGQFPTHMWTYDPAFKPGSSRWDEIEKWARIWRIDLSQIMFEEQPKEKGRGRKTYNRESHDQISHWKVVYNDRIGECHILHDKGGAFKLPKIGKNPSVYIFAEDGIRLETLPTETHGELSILDNCVFAIAKTWWTNSKWYEDPVLGALYLIHCIDSVNFDEVEQMWRSNFFMDYRNLTPTFLQDHLGNRKRSAEKVQKIRQTYVDAFEHFEHSKKVLEVPHALENTLDGEYFTPVAPGEKRKRK